MAGVKRSRAAHTGTVTRVGERLRGMPFDQPEEVQRLKVTDIKTHLKTLAKTEAGFNTSLEEAQDFLPEDEAEEAAFQQEEGETAETFTISINAAKTIGEQLLAAKAVLIGMGAFKTKVDALQHSLDSDPDQDYSAALSRLQALLSSLEEQWTEVDLPAEHPIKAELDACNLSLSTIEGRTYSAKSRSTGLPIYPSMPAFAAGHPLKELEMKLPTIDVPTFNGDVMKWCSFWSAFEATIDSKKLSKPNKLSYLRKAIKDEESQTLLYSPQEDPNFYDLPSRQDSTGQRRSIGIWCTIWLLFHQSRTPGRISEREWTNTTT